MVAGRCVHEGIEGGPGNAVLGFASLSTQGATKPVAPVRRREHTLSVFTKSPPHPNLQKFYLFLPATLAAPQRDQLSLLYVEFPFAHDLPFVKAALAQSFTFGFCLQGWFPEFNDLAHVPQMVPEKNRPAFRMVKSGTARS